MDHLFWLLLENRVEKGIGDVESVVIKMGKIEIQAAQEELSKGQALDETST